MVTISENVAVLGSYHPTSMSRMMMLIAVVDASSAITSIIVLDFIVFFS